MNKGPKSGDVYVDGGVKIHYWDWGNFGPAMLSTPQERSVEFGTRWQNSFTINFISSPWT